MKIMTVVGARPQFIKLAPLSKVLRRRHDEIVVHTGQHYDYEMSSVFFKDLEIPTPDYNLSVGSGTHAFQTGSIMMEFEKVVLKERPDMLVAFGDTNSTLAASLVASKVAVPSAHVEAGLRNWDTHFPEEVNRIVADRLAVLNFAPTAQAMANLRREGLADTAKRTGDVMMDCLMQNLGRARKRAVALKRFGLARKSYLLLTIHRPDNADDVRRLRKIVAAVSEAGIQTVFPVHPRTQKMMGDPAIKKLISEGEILAVDPLGYLDVISVLEGASAVITDSGGIQKEAYIVGTPCITLLDSTPWTETVSAGWNKLIGADVQSLTRAIKTFHPRGGRKKEYGDGNASVKILAEIEKYFEK
ncbi:MAG: UDP-N-acetylglucosamine 2-epimerase (non-hydrolyzing) [Methanobacteriota archaeon]